MTTKQREWQLKQLAAGKCPICGKSKDGPWKSRCTICSLKNRLHMRQRGAYSAWKPGSRGRLPLEVKERKAKPSD